MVDRNLIICVQLVDYARAYDSLYVEDVYNVVEDIFVLMLVIFSLCFFSPCHW